MHKANPTLPRTEPERAGAAHIAMARSSRWPLDLLPVPQSAHEGAFLITEALLEGFLKCPLKAHYLLSGRTPPKSEHDEFDERVERIYADKVRLALGSILFTEASSAVPLVYEDLSTHPDALERVGKSEAVVPIRIFPRACISDLDRVRLGFDGLVIGHVHGKVPT